MKKYIIFEIFLFLIVIIGVLYPSFNNVKTTTTTMLDFVSDTEIMDIDSNIYKMDTLNLKQIEFSKKITVLFNSENEIMSYRKNRGDDFVYFFRFTKYPKYFDDRDSIQFMFVFFILIIVAFGLTLLIIETGGFTFQSTNIIINIKDIRIDFLYIHIILEMLVFMLISFYTYTYFQTSWFNLLYLILGAFLLLFYEKRVNKVNDVIYVKNELNKKYKKLNNEYKKLLK